MNKFTKREKALMAFAQGQMALGDKFRGLPDIARIPMEAAYAAMAAAQFSRMVQAIAKSPGGLEPTAEMLDAGAQRLLRCGELEDGADWREEFDGIQIAAARNDAERVWRSMWLEANSDGD